MVSAMLIEIPYLSAHEYDARRRMISKSYYQQLRSSERQALVGPPESMREHVVAASNTMRNVDWRKARDLISSPTVMDSISIVSLISCIISVKGNFCFLSSPSWLG